MIQHHQWSLTDLENMIPFERHIYVELLQEWIKEENARINRENQQTSSNYQVDMAAELNDVVKLLQEQNGIIKTSIEGTATQQAKDSEARDEKKTYDIEVLGTLKSIQNIMGQNF